MLEFLRQYATETNITLCSFDEYAALRQWLIFEFFVDVEYQVIGS